MPSVTLKGHFDKRSILLDEPYQIPPTACLLVTLLGSGQDDERALWVGCRYPAWPAPIAKTNRNMGQPM
jgi:hypothetical protein